MSITLYIASRTDRTRVFLPLSFFQGALCRRIRATNPILIYNGRLSGSDYRDLRTCELDPLQVEISKSSEKNVVQVCCCLDEETAQKLPLEANLLCCRVFALSVQKVICLP